MIVAKEWWEARARRPEAPLAAFVLASAALLAAGVALLPPEPEEPATLILLLGLLPLLNGVADFLSFGATRFFLRLGASGRSLFWAGMDLFAGAAIFAALCFGVIGFVAFGVALGAPPVIDLDLLLAVDEREGSLLTSPGASVWLLLALASTLLPTLAHVALVCVSLAATAPPFGGWWIAGLFRKADATRTAQGGAAVLALSLTMALSLTVGAMVLAALGWGLVQGEPEIRAGLVGVFRFVALRLGAI